MNASKHGYVRIRRDLVDLDFPLGDVLAKFTKRLGTENFLMADRVVAMKGTPLVQSFLLVGPKSSCAYCKNAVCLREIGARATRGYLLLCSRCIRDEYEAQNSEGQE